MRVVMIYVPFLKSAKMMSYSEKEVAQMAQDDVDGKRPNADKYIYFLADVSTEAI